MIFHFHNSFSYDFLFTTRQCCRVPISFCKFSFLCVLLNYLMLSGNLLILYICLLLYFVSSSHLFVNSTPKYSISCTFSNSIFPLRKYFKSPVRFWYYHPHQHSFDLIIIPFCSLHQRFFLLTRIVYHVMVYVLLFSADHH